jgi:thioredoxin 1
MNKTAKIVIVLILALAVAATIALKQKPGSHPAVAIESNGLPTLIDLGSSTCIPCKAMAPILERLKKEYAGIFNVEFIDVRQNPDTWEKYGIRVIPTQIFFDADGKEHFRHEGFFSGEDILSTWKKFDINVTKKQEQE